MQRNLSVKPLDKRNAAGYHRQNGGAHPELGEGEATNSAGVAAGVGGTAPFGDKPKAQATIQQGIAYTHCKGY